MKKTTFLLTFLFLSFTTSAEYNGYHIKFSIELTNGHIKTGYVYVASAYLDSDSLTSTNYLKKALDQSWDKSNERDSLVYFTERIKYEYRNVGDSLGRKISIYALNNRQSFPSREIMSINILEMIDYTYLIGISNPLSISDTTWINKEPLSSYSFGGYLCHHQIFVHRKSKKIDKIIQQLTTKQHQLNDVEITKDNGDKIDKEFWEIVKKLYGKKVVIITECTC